MVPPVNEREPPDNAFWLCKSNEPAVMETPPKEFVPESTSAPEPAFVRVAPTAEMLPPTVSVLATTFTVRSAVTVTEPEPRFSGLLPRKVTSLDQF